MAVNNNNMNIQYVYQQNIELINIKIICYDPNIVDGDNEHHFHGCFPSFITIQTIKEKVNEVWSEQLRGENYIFKMDDVFINNEEQTIRQNNICNGATLIIERV